MATKFIFDGKIIKEPGVYSAIKSGIKNAPQALSYGNILMIDTGTFGAGYGGGSGIAGTIEQDKNSILNFDNIQDFRGSVRGGLAWLLGQPLFQPSKFGIQGVSNISYIKAAATVPAAIQYEFGDASVSDNSDSTVDGGLIKVQLRNEGIVGNGVLTGGVLTRGAASKMRRSTSDTTKYVIDFYLGTYKGADAAGDAYDFIAEAATKPELILSSPEFKSIQTLIDWINQDSVFNFYFKAETLTKYGSGEVDDSDLAANLSYNLATGGTETYNNTYLQQVLDNITDLDYTFVLTDNYGDTAQSAANGLILSHLLNDAKYEKFLIVGGGKDRNKFAAGVTNSSIETAKYYDSDRVVVVHAGVKKKVQGIGGFKEYDAIYKSALALGRIAGLPPQVPVTFKDLDMDGDMHEMNTKERIKALDAGVFHTKYDVDFAAFIVNEDINTLQNNENVLNEDGTSHLISLKRIAAQLDKEIIINAKITLLGNPNGVNRNTLSNEVVATWLDTFLKSKMATPINDNLIITFKNIVVTKSQDATIASYDFAPNTEVTKLFFTGRITEI